MIFPGFCGPSYQSQSPNVDAERLVNLYCEPCEVPGGKTQMALYRRGGLRNFCTLSGETFIPGLFQINSQAWAAGAHLWELHSDGPASDRGSLGYADGTPIIMAANQGNQLIACSGGRVYVTDLISNTIEALDPALFAGPVVNLAFVDGYFIAQIGGTNKFQLSGLLDGTSWSFLDENIIEVFPENIVTMITAFRQAWFLGSKESSGYQNTGDTDLPFQPVSGGFAEMGSGAVFGAAVLDNSPHWLTSHASGRMMAYKASGYTPTRVSNHAVETIWQAYSRTDDAISFAFQDQGHSFWLIYFPTANATWLYDAETGYWAELTYAGTDAHRARSYCKQFGKHLVGDRASGTIYEMTIAAPDDFGTPIQWMRRTPHICNEQQRLRVNSFQLDIEPGVGPMPPLLGGDGRPRDPQASARFSKDGGHTWTPSYARGIGQAGKYKTRAIWRRLGVTRDWVVEVSGSDPIVRIVAAYLEMA